MAARLRKTHQEDVKAKIQASQLVNFLQNHALKATDANTTRIDAAKFLLNKLVSNAPTDANVAHSGELIQKIEVVIVDPKA